MTRRTFITAIGVPITGLTVPTVGEASMGVHVTGPLTATAQEALEGSFHLGRELTLVTGPNSPIIRDLRRMVDQTVRVSVVVP